MAALPAPAWQRSASAALSIRPWWPRCSPAPWAPPSCSPAWPTSRWPAPAWRSPTSCRPPSWPARASLAATWVGLGFGLEEIFASSGTSVLAFGLMVVFLNRPFLLAAPPPRRPAGRRPPGRPRLTSKSRAAPRLVRSRSHRRLAAAGLLALCLAAALAAAAQEPAPPEKAPGARRPTTSRKAASPATGWWLSAATSGSTAKRPARWWS